MSYVIATDSTCDIPKQMLREMQVYSRDMTYIVNDVSYGKDEANQLEFHKFYDAMRAGARTSTSMINEETAHEFLTELLATGNDVLYLSFASALSGTYDNFKRVAEELNAVNANKVHVVDSKCASGGEGLFVTLVAEKCKSGISFDEACAYAEKVRDNVIHYFVVEDLKYLARGGRLGKGSAIFGNMLNIKPVLHVDELGRLIPIKKVMGRKKSLCVLVEKMAEKYNKESATIYNSRRLLRGRQVCSGRRNRQVRRTPQNNAAQLRYRQSFRTGHRRPILYRRQPHGKINILIIHAKKQ